MHKIFNKNTVKVKTLTMCKLCLTEKLWIINHINDHNMLNKKSELINKCRHFKKFLLKRGYGRH